MGRKQFASSEPEYASWGEAIKAYQTTHTTRAFPDDAYAKPARVTRYAKSREEVEYNPVLQTFTDGGREAAAPGASTAAARPWRARAATPYARGGASGCARAAARCASGC